MKNFIEEESWDDAYQDSQENRDYYQGLINWAKNREKLNVVHDGAADQ